MHLANKRCSDFFYGILNILQTSNHGQNPWKGRLPFQRRDKQQHANEYFLGHQPQFSPWDPEHMGKCVHKGVADHRCPL